MGAFGYDPEAIYQDADIEMMQLAEAAGYADDPDVPCDTPTPMASPRTVCQKCGWALLAHDKVRATLDQGIDDNFRRP